MGARDLPDFPLTDVDAINEETRTAIAKAIRSGFSPLAMPFSYPAPSWSVLERRIVTIRPSEETKEPVVDQFHP